MNSDSDYAHGDVGERALVGAFADRDTAHEAARRLREDGFHKIWIGVTRDDAMVMNDNDSLGAKIGRFLSGEPDGDSLIDTLRRHGVDAAEAARIEGSIHPGDAIMTMNGSNHPELAARVIEDCGGEILSGESFVFTSIAWATADDDVPGSELLGYENPDRYARGERVDDTGLNRLRDERLQSQTVPTLSEDIFVMSYEGDYDSDDDLDDPEDGSDGAGLRTQREDAGTRSAGAAIGTQQREDLMP